MTDAAFLQIYRNARLAAAVLAKQAARSGITGQPAGLNILHDASLIKGTNDTTSAALQRMDGLEQQLEDARQGLIAMEARFSRIMAAVFGYRERCILLQYYGLGMNDMQVADSLDITARHACRLRHALLSQLDCTESEDAV